MKKIKKGPFARLPIDLPSEVIVETTESGTVCVKVKIPGPLETHTLGSFFYTNWPESARDRVKMLRRSPVLSRDVALIRRLVPVITAAVRSLERKRHEFGVPLAEMPKNFTTRLRKIAVAPQSDGDRLGYTVGNVTTASTLTSGARAAARLEGGAALVTVFADRDGVFVGPPQDRRAPTVNWGEAGRLFMDYARRRVRPIEPAAITRRGLREGSLWFAEVDGHGRLTPGRVPIDLRYYAYLRKRFGSDLKFFRVEGGHAPVVGVQSGGRWVGFVERRSGTCTEAVEKLLQAAAERGKVEGRRAA